ncbi:hypothetical protein LZ554_005163 [Drepanopeziza brunnea f. sp. 'monogermtubi']|nr:hypothetical protein LZ554_005163 [Drepanopeziza brunnea f. sp. 'monogermtubi']
MTKRKRTLPCSKQGSLQSIERDSAAAEKKERKRQYNKDAQQKSRERKKERQKRKEQKNAEQLAQIAHLTDLAVVYVESYDVVVESYDVVVESYDAVVESYDAVVESYNAVVKSNDAVVESYDAVVKSNDVVVKSNDVVVKSNDVVVNIRSTFLKRRISISALAIDFRYVNFKNSQLSWNNELGNDANGASVPGNIVDVSSLDKFLRPCFVISALPYGLPITQSSMGLGFQSLNVSQSEAQSQRSLSGPASVSVVILPYDRTKARLEILELFHPIYSDPAVISDPQRHLAALRSLSESLPSSLKPSKAQLETPHHYGIDMVASPSLRDSLMIVDSEVARSFVAELGVTGGDGSEVSHVTIWGDEPLNEISWELSQHLLERWFWLLDPSWLQRANFWRRERGAPLLPDIFFIFWAAQHSMAYLWRRERGAPLLPEVF